MAIHNADNAVLLKYSYHNSVTGVKVGGQRGRAGSGRGRGDRDREGMAREGRERERRLTLP